MNANYATMTQAIDREAAQFIGQVAPASSGQQSECAQALQFLEDRIRQVDKLLIVLDDRLTPVLKLEPRIEPATLAVPQMNSPLGNQLVDLGRKVEDIEYLLNAIHRALAI